MSDLLAFLKARLDEDEAAAKAASPGQWTATGTRIKWGADTVARMAVPSGMYRTRMADAAHIARWDPARALAEVAAKRRIVEMAERTDRESDDHPGWEGAVLHLIQIYADYPDFDPAWLIPPAEETP